MNNRTLQQKHTHSRLPKYIAGRVWDVSSAQPVGRGNVAAEAPSDNSCAVRQSSHTPVRALLVCMQLFLSACNAFSAQFFQHRATPDIIAPEASWDRIPVRNLKKGVTCNQLI